MERLTLEIEAGRVSAELARRGISPATRVQVVVDIPSAEPPSQAALAQAGGAFDFLADEPDLYTDADLIKPDRPC
ncbi:MAG: hypothetical protein AB7F35_19555 [Acetobacteraceae bacterium]